MMILVAVTQGERVISTGLPDRLHACLKLRRKIFLEVITPHLAHSGGQDHVRRGRACDREAFAGLDVMHVRFGAPHRYSSTKDGLAEDLLRVLEHYFHRGVLCIKFEAFLHKVQKLKTIVFVYLSVRGTKNGFKSPRGLLKPYATKSQNEQF